LRERGERTYDAKGRLVFPGVIDGHVHFNLKYGDYYTADDFTSGTAAAACGGVTTVIDFVTPESRDYVEEFRKRRAEADGNTIVDYGVHVSVTDYGADIIEGLVKLFREEGLASVKIFTAYSKRGLMLDDGKLYRLMQLCSKHNVLVMAHCENEWLIKQVRRRVS
jgi:dihydropyrimidinase